MLWLHVNTRQFETKNAVPKLLAIILPFFDSQAAWITPMTCFYC
jgi:hypothetical protein